MKISRSELFVEVDTDKGVLMWSSCWTYSVNLSSVPGDGDGQSRWCLSQVKGAVDDDVAEGKTHP